MEQLQHIKEAIRMTIPGEKDAHNYNILKDLYRYRHELINAAVQALLEMEYQHEQPLLKHYPEYSTSLLTPDIVCKNKDMSIHYWFDISVSINPTKAAWGKIEKYKAAAKEIMENSKGELEIKFYPFAIDVDGSQFLTLIDQFETEGLFAHITSVVDDVLGYLRRANNVIRTVRNSCINKAALDDFLQKEYGDEQSDISTMKKNIDDVYSFIETLPDISLGTSSADILSENNAIDLYRELLNDPDIQSAFLETETTPEAFLNGYKLVDDRNKKMPEMNPKPSIYTMLLPCTDEIQTLLNDYRDKSLPLEQGQLIAQLKLLINTLKATPDVPVWNFLLDISHAVVNIAQRKAHDLKMFCHGAPVENWDESKTLRQEFKEYREQITKEFNVYKKTPMNFMEFAMQKMNIPKPAMNDVIAVRQKMLRIPITKFDSHSQIFLKKSGVGLTPFEKIRKLEIGKLRRTVPLEMASHVDTFLDILSESNEKYMEQSTNIDDFITAPVGIDTKLFTQSKNICLDKIRMLHSEFQKTNAYRFLKTQSLINEQLLHYMSYSKPNNQYAFFTAGIPNHFYIVRESYHDKGKDIGKSFMCVAITKNDFNTNIFGKVYKQIFMLGKEKFYVHATNWRRLTAARATFARDVFYQTISTSFTFMSRRLDVCETALTEIVFEDDIRHTIALRGVLGLSLAQSVAEKAADLKNLIMLAYSKYSNPLQFIEDKFSPPFNNIVECWLVKRLLRIAEVCLQYQTTSAFELDRPIFMGSERKLSSIGGKINIKSCWTDTNLITFQDLLDDLYVYVHTPKEPSSQHTESVKAVKTILKFQNLFDELTPEEKLGKIDSLDAMKKHLLKPISIGFSATTLFNSAKHLMTERDLNLRIHELHQIVNEPLMELSSTKACIPEVPRKSREISLKEKPNSSSKAKVKRSIDRQITEMKLSAFNEVIEPREYLSLYTSTTAYIPTKFGAQRLKVHDCLIDAMYINPGMSTLIDLVSWHILKNSSRVVADICIKAQYGAKREFYVVNLGAKAMMRLCENVFKTLCLKTKNEMISIPGDTKLLKMQDMINMQMKLKHRDEHLISVNGDCTKWSAAETLEAFEMFANGLGSAIPVQIHKLLRHIFHAWANKEIYIPTTILLNTTHYTEKTEYMRKDNLKIKSTQNFLQGLMNYASSLKAVSCAEYTKHVWKLLNPGSKINCEHMEHSDDYLLLLRGKDLNELRQFRVLHRIMMKLHGFNDSIKKTNTQTILTEFISLISINGQMTYPQIKKVKEVGLNISCEGFMSDCQDAISRSAEAFRIGAPMDSSYYMQRVHLANVLRAYSMLPGMHNQIWTLEQILNAPLEFFGVPDTLPNISLLAKGDTTLQRLRSQESRINDCLSNSMIFKQFNLTNALKLLHVIQTDDLQKKKGNFDDYIYGYTGLYTPQYSYASESKFINHIRLNLKMSFEECQDFINNHPEYMFLKPNDVKLGWEWLHYMYYSRSFAKAYSRESRSSLTLRLSRFTSTACIEHPEHNMFEDRSFLTIRQFLYYINEKLQKFNPDILTDFDWTMFERSCMSGDATVGFLYDFSKHLIIMEDTTMKLETTAVKPPFKISWLKLQTPGLELLQYCVKPEDYKLDNRRQTSKLILDSDKKLVEDFYKIKLDETTPVAMIALIAKDILAQRKLTGVYMACTHNVASPELYLLDSLKHRMSVNKRYQVMGVAEAVGVEPYQKRTIYKRKTHLTFDPRLGCLDSMLLYYGFLAHTLKLEAKEVRDIFQGITYQIPGESSTINVLECLNSMTITQPELMGLKHYHYKAISFLKVALLGNYDDIYNYSKTYMGFSYNYDRRLTANIETKVTIEFMGKNFVAIEHKNGLLLIKTETKNTTLNWAVYIIALKLCSRITQIELEDRLQSFKNIEDVQVTTAQLLNVKDIYLDSTWLIKPTIAIPVSKLELSDTFEGSPFLFSMIPRHSLRKHGKIANTITLDYNTSSLYNGGLKLFTAPYLQVENPGVLDIKDKTGLNLEFYNATLFLNTKHILRLTSGENLLAGRDSLSNHINLNSNKFLKHILNTGLSLINTHFITAYDDSDVKKLKEMCNVVIEEEIGDEDYGDMGGEDMMMALLNQISVEPDNLLIPGDVEIIEPVGETNEPALIASTFGNMKVPGELLDEEMFFERAEDTTESTMSEESDPLKFNQAGFMGVEIIEEDENEPIIDKGPRSVQNFANFLHKLELERNNEVVNKNVVGTANILDMYSLLYKCFELLHVIFNAEMGVNCLINPNNFQEACTSWKYSILQAIDDQELRPKTMITLQKLSGLICAVNYMMLQESTRINASIVKNNDIYTTVNGKFIHAKFYSGSNELVINKMKEKYAVKYEAGLFYNNDLTDEVWLRTTINPELSGSWFLPILKFEKDKDLQLSNDEALQKYVSTFWLELIKCPSTKNETELIDFLEDY